MRFVLSSSFRLAGVLWLLAISRSFSEEAPRLVIDPQGHSGLIKATIFTSGAEELVSLGNDKTIRVWDGETGKLHRTLRTEVGDAEQGKHFCGALSPDGRWLAVAGWAGSGEKEAGAIRILDFEKGTMAAVLFGHDDAVHSLSFSRDGRWLASSSSDTNVRVWDVSVVGGNDEALVIRDSEVLSGHVNKVYVVAFAGNGIDTLVSGSFDHSFRIWRRESPGKRFVERALFANHEARIFAMDVSSDGTWAVTGDDEGKLLLWNVVAGSLVKTLDAKMELMVSTISIDPDGQRVLASSKSAKGGRTVIYSLPDGGLLQELAYHDNTVTASAWHPGGERFVTAGGDKNEIAFFEPGAEEPELAVAGKGFPVLNVAFKSEGGIEFAIGFAPPDPTPVIQGAFDVEGLVARPIRSAEDALSFHGAIGMAGDDVLSFEGYGILRVGGRGTITNDYDTNDRLNVASFTEDGESVIVGSTYHLRRYVKKGGKFEMVTDYRGHEGGVRTVVPSPDGKYLVSGSIDQTARIWNLESGELLASFFPSTDGEWVLWTPDGYFAASPKGGEFIGWHFNRGFENVAKFVSGDQLHDHYYRPDVVRRSIAERTPGADIVEGLGLAFDLGEAVERVPGIAFVEPSGDLESPQRRLAVRVQATDEGGGIGEVRLFHEGKRLQPDGPGAFRDGSLEVPFTVSLLSGTNEIRAVAVNPDGVESPPETRAVTFGGTKPAAKLYLLMVGLNEYKNPRFNLDFCRPDVDALADAIARRTESLFSDIRVEKLYDAEATAENITAMLETIAEEAEADDVFVFGFAGHGAMSEGDGGRDPEFYVIPHDVTQIYGNDDLLAERALSATKLREMAARIPARKQLMVLDACQSGGVVESFAVRGAAEERALAQLARSSGMYVLASTRTEQFATETKELGHGIFTYALLEGFEGNGDGNGDGKITVKEMEAWLNERVPELSEKHTGAAQYPNSFARGQDFPIGLTEE